MHAISVKVVMAEQGAQKRVLFPTTITTIFWLPKLPKITIHLVHAMRVRDCSGELTTFQ